MKKRPQEEKKEDEEEAEEEEEDEEKEDEEKKKKNENEEKTPNILWTIAAPKKGMVGFQVCTWFHWKLVLPPAAPPLR